MDWYNNTPCHKKTVQNCFHKNIVTFSQTLVNSFDNSWNLTTIVRLLVGHVSTVVIAVTEPALRNTSVTIRTASPAAPTLPIRCIQITVDGMSNGHKSWPILSADNIV